MQQDHQQPHVSVVVPVGSIDDALLEQVAALREQSAELPTEVVLACNSSATGSLATLTGIAREVGPGWRAVDASARRGPAFARNRGAEAATGEWLLFCDADDIVAPGWVDAMAAALQEADAVTGPLPPFGPPEALAAKPAGRDDALPTYMDVPYLPSGNLGVRREAFEAVGGFDERLRTSEDIAFAWSLRVRGCRMAWAPDAVVRRRYRGGLWPMTRQHFRYGRGISRVLIWYGIPGDGLWESPGWRLFRANGGASSVGISSMSHQDVLRRGALAAGRLLGIVEAAPLRFVDRRRS